MSETIKATTAEASIPYDREKALRSMRALHEQIRRRMNELAESSKKKARKKRKKLKKSRGRMKQAFYEVTLADRQKWEKIRPRIMRTYNKALRTLEKAQV